MEYPLVSVVTLTYKKFDYIYSTIKSVLDQNYPNIEYIIADDGSPNFPKEDIVNFVKENAKENIMNFVVIDAKENVGTVKNINRAYKMAKGEYLMPLSGDDEFFDEKSISNVIGEFNRRKCEVLVTGRLVCDANLKPLYFLPHIGERLKIQKLDSKEKQYIAFITSYYYDMVSGSSLYIKKQKLVDMGYFNEEYYLWEDGPFFEKYLSNNKINIVYDLITIKYRLGGVSNGGVNIKLKNDCIRFNEYVLKKNLDSIDNYLVRKLKYINSFNECKNTIDKMFCYIKRLDVFVDRFIYKVVRKYNEFKDVIYIKKNKIQ